jgi:hypothetical protein
MVRTEVAVLAPGVMAAGEKAQLKLEGSPVQVSEMGLLKVPDCAVAATVKVPDMPERMVMVAGAALNETVGGMGAGTGAGGVVLLQLGLYAVAPLIWFARVGLPTASTNI